MEELLNKLIEKGWKPRNKEEVKKLNYHTLYREVVSLEFDNYNLGVSYSIRDLVSKESGLGQFVCENGMVKLYTKNQIIIQEEDIITTYRPDYIYHDDEYYIIMSALCNEEDLEKFLLDNIKL